MMLLNDVLDRLPAAPSARESSEEDTMLAGVLHQIMSGIATGGIYASVALALVMIYQATHHINFAQGEMATFSTYITLTFINLGMPYWAAFFLAVAVSFCIGVTI